MAIYSKRGDKGETDLLGGVVSKNSPHTEAIGTIDELNSFIGEIRSLNQDKEIDKLMAKIQDDLFVMGADISAQEAGKAPAILQSDIDFLESQIDKIAKEIPSTKNFVIPGGDPLAAKLHVTRAVSRRAERKIVALSEVATGYFNDLSLPYLNRLSDLLFVHARLVNTNMCAEEGFWIPKK